LLVIDAASAWPRATAASPAGADRDTGRGGCGPGAADGRTGAVARTAGATGCAARPPAGTGWRAPIIGERGRIACSCRRGHRFRGIRAGANRSSSIDLVTAPYDGVLDPLATATEQRISEADLRDLPVSTLDVALALSAGSVGTSYRGGRLGQESFILDGLGLKNQLDASSGSLGIVIPPDLLSEASLITNGFSARYGQALSGLVNVVTRDPGESWEGRAAYESDRPFGGSSIGAGPAGAAGRRADPRPVRPRVTTLDVSGGSTPTRSRPGAGKSARPRLDRPYPCPTTPASSDRRGQLVIPPPTARPPRARSPLRGPAPPADQP
jgi:hypothetical protein